MQGTLRIAFHQSPRSDVGLRDERMTWSARNQSLSNSSTEAREETSRPEREGPLQGSFTARRTQRRTGRDQLLIRGKKRFRQGDDSATQRE